MLELTAWLTPGFRIDDFVADSSGAIVLAIISWVTNASAASRKWSAERRQADTRRQSRTLGAIADRKRELCFEHHQERVDDVTVLDIQA